MVRGLLLDYGGVMTTSVLDSFSAFCSTEGIEIATFRQALLDAARAPESAVALMETGAITAEEFDERIARDLSDACGHAIVAQGLKQRMFAGVQPDQRMWSAVRAARRAGLRTGMLSNSWGGRDYPFEEFRDLFDVLVISGEVGMRKPDPEIYVHAAKEIGVPPPDCVFVDDFRINIDGARAVGMEAVLHRDADETIARLEELLGVGMRD